MKKSEMIWFPGIRSYEIEFLLNFVTESHGSSQITLIVDFQVSTENFVKIKFSMRLVHCESLKNFPLYLSYDTNIENSVVWKSKFCAYIRISRKKQLKKLKLSQWTSHIENINGVKFQVENRKSTFNMI